MSSSYIILQNKLKCGRDSPNTNVLNCISHPPLLKCEQKWYGSIPGEGN